MHITVFQTKQTLGAAAAADAAETIRAAVADAGRARIVAATGASQFDFLAALVSLTDVPWDRVEMFHLDEYIGIDADHPASFRRYLRERLIDPVGIGTVHLLDAVRRIAAGDFVLSPHLLQRLVTRAVQTGGPQRFDALELTAREADVLPLVVYGLSNQEIADRLHLGVTTVKTHVANLMDKLGAQNRVQLAVYGGMQLPVGVLLDRYGSRPIMTIGMVLMAAG